MLAIVRSATKVSNAKKTGTWHKLSHTPRKSHVCEVGYKSFICKSKLPIHMISHTGIRAHFCDICRIAYKYKQDLKNHTKNRYRSNTSRTLIWRPDPNLI
ncbi:hypothetical protein CDAR_410631 [Caerostris darwini]|uniref:C2H2-type domain-containing protein n=1 Tax=Caerostris darwini TaxID=1538125 RepID=A0AAV4QV67_9ARAC|nr:hypothetical protein CDAR_410631 [Caerostris darwini]